MDDVAGSWPPQFTELYWTTKVIECKCAGFDKAEAFIPTLIIALEQAAHCTIVKECDASKAAMKYRRWLQLNILIKPLLICK